MKYFSLGGEGVGDFMVTISLIGACVYHHRMKPKVGRNFTSERGEGVKGEVKNISLHWLQGIFETVLKHTEAYRFPPLPTILVMFFSHVLTFICHVLNIGLGAYVSVTREIGLNSTNKSLICRKPCVDRRQDFFVFFLLKK